MILTRLAQAIRAQNWFSVLVEILVVVIGIFLGLQVDDWNEARKHRQEEAAYLVKIGDDLAAMQEQLIARVARGEEAARRMISALRAIETCDTSDVARADIAFAMEHYQVSPPFRFLDATYGEMVATGALARLEDRDLKQQITYVYSGLGGINDDRQNFRVSLPNVDLVVWDNVTFGVDERGFTVATFDMAELCGSRPIRNAVVEMIDLQTDNLIGARYGLEMVEELLAMLNDRG